MDFSKRDESSEFVGECEGIVVNILEYLKVINDWEDSERNQTNSELLFGLLEEFSLESEVEVRVKFSADI